MQRELMTVVTDGTAFVSPAGGVRRYTHALFGALAARDDVRVVAAGAPAAAVLPAGVRNVPARPSLPSNVGWCATGLPATARRQGDVFHAPAYTAPLWGTRPLVLTVHDVSYERVPHWYPYRSDPLRRAFYRHSAHRADHVVTDSMFSRDEIVAAYGLPTARISVIPLGVEPHFTPASTSSADPYLLHVGDLHPRRQVGRLLDLVLAFRSEEPWRDLRLVLVGRDLGEGAALRARAASDPAALVLHEQVDEQRLVQLYQGARALVLVSRYEGFGLPVLEAMACGVPTVAADAGALPETAGDAALVVPVDDPRAWAEAIRAVLEQAELRDRLRAAGLRRAAAFTWARVADSTLEVYQSVAGV